MSVIIVSLAIFSNSVGMLANENVSKIFSMKACNKTRTILRIHGRQKAVHTAVAAFNPGVLLKMSMQSPKEKAHNINPLRLLSESIFNKK